MRVISGHQLINNFFLMQQQHSPQMHFEFEHLTIPLLLINQQFVFFTELLKRPQGIAVIYCRAHIFLPERLLISFCICRADSCSEVPALLPWRSVNNVYEGVPLNLISQPQLTHSLQQKFSIYFTFLFAFHSLAQVLKSLILLRKDTDMLIFLA